MVAKQADEDSNKPWMIRDVPDHVRVAVKTYAVQHKITVAEALTQLVDIALDKVKTTSFTISMDKPEDLANLMKVVQGMLPSRNQGKIVEQEVQNHHEKQQEE